MGVDMIGLSTSRTSNGSRIAAGWRRVFGAIAAKAVRNRGVFVANRVNDR
jgi:hypothetical protein